MCTQKNVKTFFPSSKIILILPQT
uniref:Uncharacterized protein n=1 Tax=Anguilla anguilla TaxID=7936 RepID=A0A0E9UTS8_ANGAN